jgi:hypothetical protein
LLVNLEQRAATATQLDALLADRARIGAMGRAARHSAETIYCWEKETPVLLATVARALAPSKP